MKPFKTSDVITSKRKILLYANAGFGKTTQFAHFQEAYGPGLILSGESGLSSIRSANIDFIPFSSWDEGSDPDKGLYSFVDIFKWTRTPEFLERGYNWIGIDSLTELSDLSFHHAEREQQELAKKANKKGPDGFAVWGNHAAQVIGACKAIRDMPMHVMVTCLAKETQDENGALDYWPMVAGKQAMQQLPGIFDIVLGGVRVSRDEGGQRIVDRYIVTDEVRGYHGKVRDEHRRLKPVERLTTIPELLARLDMSDDEWATYQNQE